MAEEYVTLSLSFPSDLASCSPEETAATEQFRQLCDQISKWPQCHATLNISTSAAAAATPATLHHRPSSNFSPVDTRHQYNVTVSGPYPRVMEARGAFLRSNPLKTTLTMSVSKDMVAALTESPESEPVEKQPATPRASTPANAGSDAEKPDTPRLISTASGPTSAPATPSPSNFGEDQSSRISPAPKSLIGEISSITRTAITIASAKVHLGRTSGASFGRDENAVLSISGTLENAETAKRLLLISIDTLRLGTVEEIVQIGLQFQNLIGGRKRQWLQDLMAKTKTSIYLASPFVLTGADGEPMDRRHNFVSITGEPAHVQMAKAELMRVYGQVQPKVVRLSVDIANRKLDWMLQNERSKLRAIMEDNATFIVFPHLGASLPTIYVLGAFEVDVRRTIRTVMQLSCQFHSGSINVLPATMVHTHTSAFNDMCSPISHASGAEVEYRGHAFQIFGTEFQTMEAARVLAKFDVNSGRPLFEYQFLIELPNEHREFISGKKNGKINRIMKETGVKIKFEPCNDCNFYVELRSAFADKTIEALALMQKELPAEISFFVPERYHKRIIGVGGKNIQRIMKKYGVYVKFSNAEEFAKLGGYFDNLDNVVVKTPSKNAINLDNLKQEVMGFVEDRDKDLVNHSLCIRKEEHLSLLSDHIQELSELLDTTNSMIRFPARESGSDLVQISGPQTLIQQAIDGLLKMVEEHFSYPVPYSEAMDQVLESSEFQSTVVDVIRRNWNITLHAPGTKVSSEKENATVPERTLSDAELDASDKIEQLPTTPTPSSAANKNNALKDDHLFIFRYKRDQEYHIQEAKKLLIRFLDINKIRVYDDDEPVEPFNTVSIPDMALSFSGMSLNSSPEDVLTNPSLEYALFDSAPGSFSTNGSGQQSLRSSGSLMAPELRSLFPSISTTVPSPRWSDQSARYGSAFQGSHPNLSAPGSVPSLTSPNGVGSVTGSQYSRPTSLPSDPWGTVQPQHRPLGSIGDIRSSGANLSNGSLSGVMNGSTIGSHQYGQGGYRKAPGYGVSTFGPGYGPTLNSGARASPQPQQRSQQLHQQAQHQNQQQSFGGQTYPSHPALAPGYLYPQQRQRHSSHNSAASHHTMGLGPIGGGIDSTGGSISSDEVSTEDDSDDPFDEMRAKRMQHTQSLLQGQLLKQQQQHNQFQQQPHQQQLHHPQQYQHYQVQQQPQQTSQHQSTLFGNGYESYGTLGSSIDVASSLNMPSRRSSSGSLRSGSQMQLPSQQQPLQSYYAKHQQDYYTVGQDAGSVGRSSLANGNGQSRHSGFLSQGSSSLHNHTGGEDLDHSEFFSSGLGGIIGQGSNGFGGLNGGSIHLPEVTKSRRTGTGSSAIAVGGSQDSGLPMTSLFGNDAQRWAFP